MSSKFDFSDFDLFIKDQVKTAVIDIDNTITRSHIGMLLLFIKQQQFKEKRKSTWEWKLWKLQFVLFKMLPILLVDHFSRNLAQRLSYRLYRKVEHETLEKNAQLLFEQVLKHRFIPYIHDLIFHLKQKNIEVVLLSTNLEAIAKQYAQYFGCSYQALPNTVIYDDKLLKALIYPDFKKQSISAYNAETTLAIADSIHDKSVFRFAKYSAIVCKTAKAWMKPLDARLIYV